MARERKKKAPTTRRRKAATRPRRASKSRQAENPHAPPPAPGVITIRKYANRRLYDTAASAHLTQEDLYRLVGRGAIVRIIDASTGEDITNQTLALALIEHDPAKLRLVPAWLLHQMIRLHEQALGGWLGALWQAAGAAGPGLAWPALDSAWPGAGGMTSWPAWAPGAPAAPSAAAAGAAEEVAADRRRAIADLRLELDRLLRRLGDLERPG